MAANGLNIVRASIAYGQPLVSGPVDNTSVGSKEANFGLNYGGIDWQVQLAQRCQAQGMRVMLTIQFGQDGPVDNWHEYIPADWLKLTYQQTLDKTDAETRRMLQPFIDAGVQPDVIIVENEGDSGMLFQYLGADGKMHIRDNRDTDVFSDVATGVFSVWPKCAGYFKRVILSSKDAMAKKGWDNTRTRFSVHTTTNPFRSRSTCDRIFNNRPDAEQVYYNGNVINQGVVTAIPAEIRNQNLRDLIDVVGFSYYPPLPADGSAAAFDQSFSQFTGDMDYMKPILKKYGRFANGPFAGQFKKQAFIIEFAAGTDASIGFDEARLTSFTTEFFRRLASYEVALGAMWWEPTYANNNWHHYEGSMYRTVAWDASISNWAKFRPLDLIKTWGSFASPPCQSGHPSAICQRDYFARSGRSRELRYRGRGRSLPRH